MNLHSVIDYMCAADTGMYDKVCVFDIDMLE